MNEVMNNPIISACAVFVVTFLFKDFFISLYTAIITTQTRQYEIGDKLSIRFPDSNWEKIEIVSFFLNPFSKKKIGVYVLHDDGNIERVDFGSWRICRKKGLLK